MIAGWIMVCVMIGAILTVGIAYTPTIVAIMKFKSNLTESKETSQNYEVTDTLKMPLSRIYLIPIPKNFRGRNIDSIIASGEFDMWIYKLREEGYEWTGSFGYEPHSRIPFKKLMNYYSPIWNERNIMLYGVKP